MYAEGYSGGGETLSRVMGMRPELFTAYLQCSSQWDGNHGMAIRTGENTVVTDRFILHNKWRLLYLYRTKYNANCKETKKNEKHLDLK